MNEENNEKVDLFLNTKGVPCPIPSMRVRLNMLKIPPGGIMKVVSNAQHTKNSITRYCRNFGHEILMLHDEDGVITFIIRKSSKEEKKGKKIRLKF